MTLVKRMGAIFNPYLWVIGAVTVFMASLARAQEVAQEQLPGWMGTVENGIQQMDTPIVATILIMLVESVLRLVKTKNPRSLLYLLANGFRLMGVLFEKLSQLLDKVAQRTKEETPKAP